MGRKKKKLTLTELYNEKCKSYKDKYNQPETWKMISYNGYPTIYAVSNYGRVINSNTGKSLNINYENSHFKTNIYYDDANGKQQRVHIGTYRLVALMFIPVPQKYFDAGYTIDDLVVDHKRDGEEDNFDDNTVWNLQWLTHRENISKAANCGFRPMYPKEFRDELDKMILEGYDNPSIYEMCENKYGYDKSEIKSQIQVRRRRLGKTLKEHHENDKAFTAQIDEYVRKGYSNNEIIEILNMPTERYSNAKKRTKSPAFRLLNYRREVLGIPAQSSKYFTNEQNALIEGMFNKGMTINEIIEYFGLGDSPDINKIKSTLVSRRGQYKKRLEKENASSTTIESIA